MNHFVIHLSLFHDDLGDYYIRGFFGTYLNKSCLGQ